MDTTNASLQSLFFGCTDSISSLLLSLQNTDTKQPLLSPEGSSSKRNPMIDTHTTFCHAKHQGVEGKEEDLITPGLTKRLVFVFHYCCRMLNIALTLKPMHSSLLRVRAKKSTPTLPYTHTLMPYERRGREQIGYISLHLLPALPVCLPSTACSCPTACIEIDYPFSRLFWLTFDC